MSNAVYLLGLDIGSTTTHMLVAEAELLKNCVTGRLEFDSPKVFFRSEPVFTPFVKNEIDLEKLSRQISQWLNQSKINVKQLSAGGAIVTGLASKKENAIKIKKMVKELVSDSMVATAEDPLLESWLAFKGNCASLSQNHPEVTYLNFDIGGGTTNLAYGRNQEISSTGCLFIGARHFRFKEGTYVLLDISEYGKRLLLHLKIDKAVGKELTSQEVKNIVSHYISALESIASGKKIDAGEALYDYFPHLQLKETLPTAQITFSGGVGELVYYFSKEGKTERVTRYGDLGEELALAILSSPILSKDLKNAVPVHLGRATVFGMTLHQVDVSGTTIYLSDPVLLPCEDIPIVTTLDLSQGDKELEAQIARLSFQGKKVGAFLLLKAEKEREQILRLTEKMHFFHGECLVLFVEGNIGKTVGNYLTDWGKRSLNCIVVDEVPLKNAQFASLGRMLQSSIPVSFYGMK